MHEVSFEEAVEQIRAKDARYHLEAYEFIREALEHTKKGVAKQSEEPVLHVTGQQLLSGIREFALAQFGPMAMSLLEEWGIKSCKDFGELVFNMVDHGVLAKTETDTRGDFADGYDFWEAFRRPFLPSAGQLQPPGKSGEPPDTRREQTSHS